MKFQNGINADSSKYGNGIKYISVTDILNNKYITYENIKGLINIDETTKNKFLVEYGDILFQRSSETFLDIGRSNVYLDKDISATFGGFVIRGKRINDYDPLFFKYLLDSPNSRKKIIKMGAGAQHFNIGQECLESIELYLPYKSEQIKIGELLSHLDDKIFTQMKIIRDLIILKKAISSKILYNSGYQYIPLRKYGTLKNGYAFKSNNYQNDGAYKIITISNVSGNRYINVESCNTITDIPDDLQAHQKLMQNDILISLTGNVGRVSICNEDNCLLNQRVGVLSLNNKKDFEFIYQCISNTIFEKKMISKGQGAAQLNIGKDDVETFCIPKLDESIKSSYCNLLLDIDKKIAIEESILNDYTKEKSFFLSKLFI